MHWPSAAPGAAAPAGERRRARCSGPAAAPVGERRRARRSGPAVAVLHPGARRSAAALEDRAEPSDAQLVHLADQVLGLAAVGGAGMPARGRRGDQASRVEPRRPDVRRSGRIVARRPAGGHLPARECPPDETMGAVSPSRARPSVRAEITRRQERLPRCVDSLRIRLVTRRSVPAECAAARQSAARRSERDRPHQRTLPAATTPDGTRFAGGPRRSEVPELSQSAPQVSGSAW